jgi:hypothetical protein
MGHVGAKNEKHLLIAMAREHRGRYNGGLLTSSCAAVERKNKKKKHRIFIYAMPYSCLRLHHAGVSTASQQLSFLRS